MLRSCKIRRRRRKKKKSIAFLKHFQLDQVRVGLPKPRRKAL